MRHSALGYVAGDLGEPDKLALFVADRIEYGERPEPAAVLADVPNLVFPATAVSSNAQGVSGFAGGAVFGGEEHREVAADDLGFGIAL